MYPPYVPSTLYQVTAGTYVIRDDMHAFSTYYCSIRLQNKPWVTTPYISLVLWFRPDEAAIFFGGSLQFVAWLSSKTDLD